jgi:hypothetical protein
MLLGWRPAALEEHAAAVVRLRSQVESATVQAQSTQRAIPELWTGAAADAATTRLRGRIATGDRLTETLDGVRRVLLGACDALTAAQALLVRAQEDAAAAHLTLTRDGSVLPPPPRLLPQDASDDLVAETRRARIAQIETAESVEASVRQALRAAEEADADAAHALRSVWADAADGSGTADRAAEEAILLRTVPGPGTDPAEVAAWWASLSPEAQDLLVDRAWAQLGNLDGIPYPVRIRANRLAISAELAAEVRRQGALGVEQASLEARIAEIEASGLRDASTLRALGDLWERLGAVRAEDAASRAQSDWYQTLLGTDLRDDEGRLIDPPRQVVLFDPEGSRFAEVVGDLSTATSVGVLVPGTGAHVGPKDGTYDRALEFVKTADGRLAVITFIGGPMPAHLGQAPLNSFADAAGPNLARFVAGIDHLPGATVTAVGHSYGGSVVGAAEAAGMRVDRVLHVESAGIGASVFTPEDLAYPGTPRYSMTAPGDPIELTQGVHAQGLGHGADPDTFPGVTRLETGLRDASDTSLGRLTGVDAHTDVFEQKSTAWANMLAVMVGDEVTLYAEPEVTGATRSGVILDYPMDDPGFQPERRDVP